MGGRRLDPAARLGGAAVALVLLTGTALAACSGPGDGTPEAVAQEAAASAGSDEPAWVPRDDFPDAGTTGVPDVVSLRPWTGAQTITQAGTVIDGYLVEGGLTILADDVTIRNSLVRGGRIHAGYGTEQTGLTVIDSTLDGAGQVSDESAIGDANYTCIRCDIFGFGNGPRMSQDVVVQDSWIHDLCCAAPGDHRSGIGSNGGSGFVVRNNVVDCGIGGCSGALVLYGDNAPVTDVLVVDNLFMTLGGYCTHAGSVPGKAYPDGADIRYVGNHFSQRYHPGCGGYGPVASWADNPGNEWTGNVVHETGADV